MSGAGDGEEGMVFEGSGFICRGGQTSRILLHTSVNNRHNTVKDLGGKIPRCCGVLATIKKK